MERRLSAAGEVLAAVVLGRCPTCHGNGFVVKTQQSIFGMMQTQAVCPTCGGEGTIIKNKCKECGGEGVVNGEEVIEVKIPAGVGDGMVVTVTEKAMLPDVTESRETFKSISKKNRTRNSYGKTII